MEYKGIKIKGRILLPIFIVVGMLVLGGVLGVRYAVDNYLRKTIRSESNHLRLSLRENCSDDAKLMEGLMDFISRNKKLKDAWRRKDRVALLAEATPIFERIHKKFNITHFYFTGKDRVCFLRIHNPSRNGDVINRETTLLAESRKKVAYGLELGKFGTFTLRCVRPWVIDGEIVGYIELGEELSVITKKLSAIYDTGIVFTIQKSFLDRTDWEEGQRMMGEGGIWGMLDDCVVTCNTLREMPSVLRDALNSYNASLTIQYIPTDNSTFGMVGSPLVDCANRRVGSMVVLVDVSHALSNMRTIVLSMTVGGILGLMILYLVFNFYLGSIEKRLTRETKLRDRALLNAEESEKRLKLIADSLQAGVVMVDYDTHEILEVNAFAARIIGLKPDEIVGRKCHKFICPAECGACPITDKGMSVDQSERIIITADGRTVPILKSVVTLELAGKHVLVENFIDISKMKDVENRLRLAAENWQRTFDSMDEMISIIDKDFRIIDANKAMKDAFGDNLTGVFCHDVVHALSSPPDVCPVRKMMETGEPVRTEFFEERLNMWLDVGVFPVTNEKGDIVEFIHSVRNITERKKAENELKKATQDAEAAVKAKSEFLASMSHEIRTPMNGVIGMSDLLMGTELTEEQLEYAETIRVSGANLVCIINDILDFSKIESGNLELEKRDFELASCVEGVLEILSEPSKKKDIELSYLIHEGVPDFICGDSTRLRQILINLTNNALKFTERGEVFISIEMIREDDSFVELSFAVKDTGIGIPKNKLDILFKAFTQVDSSTTRKYGGTGLGLAISKRLAELMGGRISVTSKLGEGSTFTFSIKAGKVLNPPKKRNLESTNTIKNMRVLIVDDNETNRRILSILCGKWGMRPVVVNGGAAALKELTGKKKFQLALLDMHMPEMDGFMLSKKIRENFTKKELPIIMLSSHGSLTEIAAIKNLVNDYLAKPIKQSMLLDTILLLFEKNKSSKQELIDTAMDYSLNDALATTNPMRILVAEDNKINQKVILKTLEKMGYSADIVDNGKKAVEAVASKEYDLIFMDVHMPVMDGLEATREIRGKTEKAVTPVIIAMTANAMDGDKEICLESGMNDYVTKPISVIEVQHKIELWSPLRKGV